MLAGRAGGGKAGAIAGLPYFWRRLSGKGEFRTPNSGKRGEGFDAKEAESLITNVAGQPRDAETTLAEALAQGGADADFAFTPPRAFER